MSKETFFRKIRTYGGLSAQAERDWAVLLEKKPYRKGSDFIAEGQIPRRAAFVLKGLFSQHYTAPDGGSVIKYFFPEQRIAASVSAMLLGKPSAFAITALESSLVLEYSFAEFKKLVARHADIAAFYIRYMEQHWIIEKEPVEVSLRHDSAKTRYVRFSQEHPELLKRLKQHHIAAFLGIAPESLSRIRKEVAAIPLTNINALETCGPYRPRHQPKVLFMTQAAKARFALELKWALLFSLMYLVWMLAERVAGFHDTRLHQQPMVGPLILIPSILIYWLTLRDRKRSLQGGMTYRQGFISGCVLTVFVVLLGPLNQAAHVEGYLAGILRQPHRIHSGRGHVHPRTSPRAVQLRQLPRHRPGGRHGDGSLLQRGSSCIHAFYAALRTPDTAVSSSSVRASTWR